MGGGRMMLPIARGKLLEAGAACTRDGFSVAQVDCWGERVEDGVKNDMHSGPEAVGGASRGQS